MTPIQKRINDAPHIQNVEEYHPSEILKLSITQTSLTPAQQKKLVSRWCALLPTLKEVNFLLFSSRVNQEMFDAACAMPNIKHLFVKWSGITQIRNLPEARKLRHLDIGPSSMLEGIEELAQMRNLITLTLQQLNKIDDFTAISNLTQLEGLGINGNWWARQPQHLLSLKPIAQLTELKHLTLINTQATDKSFDPLLGLHKLERFECSWNYPEAEFAKLKKLPNLKHGNVETSWKESKRKIADGSY